jgi:4-alpha-glucanotransferase
VAQNYPLARPDTTPKPRRRFSGLLLHPTSLPSPHGIGDLGPEAYRFVDFLADSGQTLWQILPLGPVGFGNSPYAAHSAFAGNPLLISLDELADLGLLTSEELQEAPVFPPGWVDYDVAARFKLDLLRRAAQRYRERGGELQREYEAFRHHNASWLDDYSLFAALSDAHEGGPWQSWRGGVAHREPDALEQARQTHADEVEFHAFAQFLFWEQWGRLRQYANEREIKLIGDIPIFVAEHSADVWAHREMFSLNARGAPIVVAGVPPDLFSATGQRWGNPLYRWDVLEAEGYGWWIERFRATLRAVDIIRIDHFRGFAGYYEIPARAPTAERGRWRAGPGIKLFEAARHALHHLQIVVEDLGLITPDVVALRDALRYPGMRVLQFAFGGDADNPYLPHNFEANTVAYTGTHDNDTTLGWYESSPEEVRHHIRKYLGVDGHDVAWDMIRALLASVSERVVTPVQDVLALGTEARMNYPGRAAGNWEWRLLPDQLTALHAERLRDLTELYGRAVTEEPTKAAP